VKALPLRTSLTIIYTSILAVFVAGLGLSYHYTLIRQLNDDATGALEEKARGLRGYLQFKNGVPVLVYSPSDSEEAAFIDDATDYYQVYDARPT
jgi:hypothetical protein